MALRRLRCEFALIGITVQRDVLIEIDHGMIVACVPECSETSGAEQLAGLTMPGFANAHSHAFHRALRGRTHAGHGDFWSWRTQMYQAANQLNPDTYRELATAVFSEMLLAGVTCVGEFHYVHHGVAGQSYDDPNAMGHAILDAAQASGIRLTLLDTCYLAGGINRDLEPAQLRFADADADAWSQRVSGLRPDAQVLIGTAIHSVRAVPRLQIGAVVEFATNATAVLHAHVSEQPQENADTEAAYGCSPTMLLAEQGALSDRFTAVHATHLLPEDVAALRADAANVCLCPSTEADLADGVGPSVELQRAGVNLCLGSDSHAMIDPFLEMRSVELHQRLVSLKRGNHQTDDLLAMGLGNGYRALGWQAGGQLGVGALADLCTVALDSQRLAGTPQQSWRDAVVFSASPADVRSVIVGGRTIVSEGRHVRWDVPSLLSSSIAAVRGDGG